MTEEDASSRPGRGRTAASVPRTPAAVVRTALLAFCGCLGVLSLLPWGLGDPVFDWNDRFNDLTDYYGTILNLAAGAGGESLNLGLPVFNYPAPALYVYAFFIRLFPDPAFALICFDCVMILTGLLVLTRALLKRRAVEARWIYAAVLMAVLGAYPFGLMLITANLEGVVWSFTFLGFAFFVAESYPASALFWAAAVCIKPFPALFFFLLLGRRRYKETAAAFVAVCLANVAALEALGPTIAIAYAALQRGVSRYFETYVAAVRIYEIPVDHSAFSCLKQVIRVLVHHESYVRVPQLAIAYEIFFPISLLLVLACGVYFWRKPILNQVFAIALLMMLVPPVSFDYTLATMYLVWGAFLIFLTGDVASGRVAFSLKKSLWILISFAVIMAPEPYLALHGDGFAGQVKALVMIGLLIFVARNDMPSSLFGELPGANTTPGKNAIGETRRSPGLRIVR